MKELLSLLLCCIFMTACTAQPAETTQPAQTPPKTEIHTESPETTAVQDSSLPLNIFVPNENAEDFNTIPMIIDELDAKRILDKIIQYSILNEDIELNSIELAGSQLNLDFNQAFLDQLLTYGTSGERMMIGSVVNTFLSVYDAQTVYITVNGQIMESGHVIYDFPMEFFE